MSQTWEFFFKQIFRMEICPIKMNLIADLDQKTMTGSEQNEEEEEVSDCQEVQNDEGSLVISRVKEKLVEVIM